MNPPRRPLRASAGGDPPFPNVGAAFLLAFGAIVASGFVSLLFLELGPLAAEGLGAAFGIGAVATLAARRVAEPQGPRIGLVPLDWRALSLIFCLVPAVLIQSELDNFAYDWTPTETNAATTASSAATTTPTASDDASATRATAGEIAAPDVDAATKEATVDATVAKSDASADAAAAPTEKTRPVEEEEPAAPLIDPDDPFSLMEGLIVTVGIAPVVDEFLFRGVIQQGLVAQLGLVRGVTSTTLLWTILPILVAIPSQSPLRSSAQVVTWFMLGWLLGMVRVATGSILGSILLSSLWAAVGLAASALVGRIALPGMNVDGTHLPAAVTIASVLIVGAAAWKTVQKANAAGGSGSSTIRPVD